MGAINYGSSNLLNIGFNINIFKNDYEEEQDQDQDNYFIYDIQQEYYEEVKNIINKYNNINYYDVELEPGYYEGFYINIKRRYLYFDNYQERAEMQKDFTKIKQLIKELLQVDYMQLYSSCGWCGCGWIDNPKKHLKNISKIEKDVILHKYKLSSNFNSYKELIQYTTSNYNNLCY